MIGQLSKQEQVKYHLISRYENKVSQRLLDEAKVLMEKGKAKFEGVMKELMEEENSFLKLIKKDNSWKSVYIPIPFKVD
jgi:hypothetical protein